MMPGTEAENWIKLHRKIANNIFLMKDNTACLVFLKLLVYVNSNGQWAGGRFQLSELMNLGPSTLYKALQRLEEEHLIKISSNTKYTVYSICNWSKYQSSGNRPNRLAVTSGEQHGNSTVTAREHSNKIKNKKEIKNTTNVVADKPPEKHDVVGRLFYQVIKALKLPIQNHNVIHAKIKMLKTEAPEIEIVDYLEFMRDHYGELDIGYKPEVSTALDLYSKRMQIVNAVKRTARDQNQPIIGVVA